MATIFGDVQYSQVMGHLPTPDLQCLKGGNPRSWIHGPLRNPQELLARANMTPCNNQSTMMQSKRPARGTVPVAGRTADPDPTATSRGFNDDKSGNFMTGYPKKAKFLSWFSEKTRLYIYGSFGVSRFLGQTNTKLFVIYLIIP